VCAIGEVEKGLRRSDRQRDLAGPLEPADRLASPPIRHPSVDEARLDVSMGQGDPAQSRSARPRREDVSPSNGAYSEIGIAGTIPRSGLLPGSFGSCRVFRQVVHAESA
jgi:hypothetical protein